MWLPIAFICTVLAGTFYIAVQQNYRQNANDPQKQIAQDISNSLWNGNDPQKLIPNQSVNAATSLSPFVQIYDSNFNLIAGNVYIDTPNNIPKVSKGVLEAARMPDDLGDNSVTWAPEPRVRIATVVMTIGDKGYVLVGRNLKVVENREQILTYEVGFGWLVATFGSLVLIGILEIAL